METIAKLIEQLEIHNGRINKNFIFYKEHLNPLMLQYSEILTSFRKFSKDKFNLFLDEKKNEIHLEIEEEHDDFVWFMKLRFLNNGNFLFHYSKPFEDVNKELDIQVLNNELTNFELIGEFLENYVDGKSNESDFPMKYI